MLLAHRIAHPLSDLSSTYLFYLRILTHQTTHILCMLGLRHKMSHQNAPGPSVPVPPTQFNLGNGQGNLPSDFVLSSRDLGRLNPGLSESCNFNLQASPSHFKVHYITVIVAVPCFTSHVCQVLQRTKNKWSETPCHQSQTCAPIWALW